MCRRYLPLVATIVAFLCRPALAQVYGSQATIVSIDPATGTIARTGITGVSAYQGESTADTTTRRIFVLGPAASGKSTLTTISLATNSVSQVLISGSSPFIEYDVASNLIYGLQGNTIVVIDPNTGSVTPTAMVLPAASVYFGESTFDPGLRRIFLLGTDGTPGQSILSTISLTTSTVGQVIVSGTSFFIEYAGSTGLLYGLQGDQVVTINPSTGAVTTTGMTLPLSGVYQGESTIDPLQRRIFLLGSGNAGQSTLTMISVVSSIAAQTPVAGTSFFIEFLIPAESIPLFDRFFVVTLALALGAVGIVAGPLRDVA